MSQTVTTWLAAVGTLVALTAVAAGVWANFRSTALEASNKRLRDENQDYLRRLNYLEPRVELLERENTTLRTLVNPAAAIKALGEQEADNHRETVGLMQQHTSTLEQLLRTIHDDLAAGNG